MRMTFVRLLPATTVIGIALVLAAVLADDGTKTASTSDVNLAERDPQTREMPVKPPGQKSRSLSSRELSVIQAITDLRRNRKSIIDGTILDQPVYSGDETQKFSELLEEIAVSQRPPELTSPGKREPNRLASQPSSLRMAVSGDQELVLALELAARLLDRKGEESKSVQNAGDVEQYYKLAYKLRAMTRKIGGAASYSPVQKR